MAAATAERNRHLALGGETGAPAAAASDRAQRADPAALARARPRAYGLRLSAALLWPALPAPRPKSIMEERASAAGSGGWEVATVITTSRRERWVPFLLQREWRDCLDSCTVAAGRAPFSLFVDANRALMACGFENRPGTLGLPREPGAGNGPRTVLVPTPVPSMAGIPIRHVVTSYDCSLAVTSKHGRLGCRVHIMWVACERGGHSVVRRVRCRMQDHAGDRHEHDVSPDIGAVRFKKVDFYLHSPHSRSRHHTHTHMLSCDRTCADS